MCLLISCNILLRKVYFNKSHIVKSALVKIISQICKCSKQFSLALYTERQTHRHRNTETLTHRQIDRDRQANIEKNQTSITGFKLGKPPTTSSFPRKWPVMRNMFHIMDWHRVQRIYGVADVCIKHGELAVDNMTWFFVPAGGYCIFMGICHHHLHEDDILCFICFM